MAYIEKITNMRRLALVWAGYRTGDSNGAIQWEGVNIEGTIVIKQVFTQKVEVFHEDELPHFCEKEGLEVVYQDPDTDDMWEPRADLPEYMNE